MKSSLFLPIAVAFVFCLAAVPASASTAAFGGEVTDVQPPSDNDKKHGTLANFTVRIDYYDYCSWGKFGKDSEMGEPITRKVKAVGTFGMIDGRPVNATTFAKAIRPGLWGYFYEDTWLDLQTTPNFLWGEVIKSGAKDSLTIRVHRTHKGHHIEKNPPIEKTIELEPGVEYRMEEKPANADDVLTAGTWIQVHPPRPQTISFWTKESAFDPKELLPHEEGKRGFANDLCAPAILHKVTANDPEGVIDFPAEIDTTRTRHGKDERLTLQAKSVSFSLDGKLAPAKLITARTDRRGSLGHYRNQDRPHKVFVRSFDNALRGTISKVAGDTITLKTSDGRTDTIKFGGETRFLLDGCQAEAGAATVGLEVTVFPARGQTVIAIPAG